MAKVSFSGQNTTFDHSIDHYRDLSHSLHLFFSPLSPLYPQTFFGFRQYEVMERLDARLEELDLTTTMSLLASVEAMFRVDYLRRCYDRKPRDTITGAFRDIYADRGEKASLEEDILEVWKANTEGTLISDLKGAIRFRHWLAHGRYWSPKLGRKYDHTYVYSLAVLALDLPLAT